MKTRSSFQRMTPHRAAYTLIEMLIAVSLVAVLMIAVWGLMSMYTTLQNTGAEATAEQQLVRSVLQLIHSDLTTVPLPPADDLTAIDDPFAAFEPVETGSGTSGSGSDSFRVAFDISDLQQNPDAGPANFTLTGTETAIRFTLPRPAPPSTPPSEIDRLNQLGGGSAEMGDRLPDGVAPVVTEFQTVIWQFQPFGSTEQNGLPFGLYRIQSAAAHLQTILSYQRRPDEEFAADPIHLDQEMLELLLFPPPDDVQNQSTQPPAESLCDLIPEVVGCRFEYYSGGRWETEWESSRSGTLPDAIRVSLDVVSARELADLKSVFVAEGPPGPLEQQLNRRFRGPRPSSRAQTDATSLEELRIVPRQYNSIILLNPTVDSASRSPLDDGGFDL